MSALAFLLILFVGPMFAAYAICVDRNRDPLKGVVVTGIVGLFFCGWLVPFFLWLGLKHRSPKTLMLY